MLEPRDSGCTSNFKAHLLWCRHDRDTVSLCEMFCLARRCIFEAAVFGTQLLTDIAFRTRLLTDIAFRTQLLTDIAFRTRLLTDIAFRTQLLTDIDFGLTLPTNITRETQLFTEIVFVRTCQTFRARLMTNCVPARDLVSTTVEIAQCLAMPARPDDHEHHTTERSLAAAVLHQTTPSTPRVAIALDPGWLNSSASSTSAPSRPIAVFVVARVAPHPPTYVFTSFRTRLLTDHCFQDPTPDRNLVALYNVHALPFSSRLWLRATQWRCWGIECQRS